MNIRKVVTILAMGLGLTATAVQAQTSWRGTSSTAWETAANWTAGVPTTTGDAIIGDASFTGANQPTISATAVCKSLSIGVGTRACTLTANKGITVYGNITIGTNGTISHKANSDIILTGNWTNSGSYTDTKGSSQVRFNGTSQFVGGRSTTTFRRVSISSTSTTVLAANISVAGSLTVDGILDPGVGYSVSGSGTMTVAAGGKIYVRAGTFADNYPITGGNTLSTASTVDYAASGNQTVLGTLAYSTLRISGTGVKTLDGNLIALGAATAGDGNLNIAEGTLELSSFTASRGTNVAGGTISVAAGAALKIGGSGTFPANFAIHALAASSTVEYSGSAQTISPENYGHLATSGSGVKTLGGNAAASGNVSLGGGAFADGGFVLTVNGDLASSVTHSGEGRILLSGGTTNHVLSGGGQFQNLELNDSNGALLSATNLTVNGALTLTTGTIVTTTNKVVLAAGAGLSRTNGYVIGLLQKNIPVAAATNRTFEIGDAVGYTPVSVQFTNVTVAGNVLAGSTAGDNADIANSGLAAPYSVNRFWLVKNTGVTFASAAAILNFLTNDIDAGASPALFAVSKRLSGAWSMPTVAMRTGTNIFVTGLTNLGEFAVGQASAVPTITNQPASVRVNLGRPASFSVVAGSPLAITYQWRLNGTNVSGATNATYSIPSVADAQAGNYSVVVASLGASVTSSNATLTINHAPSLTMISSPTINELVSWNFTNSVSDVDGGTLTYSLTTAPSGASIDASGVISWTPTEAQGPSTSTFTVQVSDDSSPALTDSKSFSVVVNEVNIKPTLTMPASQMIDELTTLTATNTATDADAPATTLTYSLISAPSGMSINAGSGVISWTPTEAQGPGMNTVTVQVADNGSPALTDSKSFTVIVSEVNSAPSLAAIADQSVNESTTLNLTASATDSDSPTNTLTYSLVTAPGGMSINASSGAISWTPTEAEGPSTNTVTLQVADSGTPAATDTKSFTVVVTEVNSAPAAPVIADQVIKELTLLTVTNSATDADVPANALIYTLLAAPGGATIDTNGVITWTPTEAQGPSMNIFTARVTDSGSPALSATNSFQVVVNEVNVAPSLIVPATQTVNELATLTVTNTAMDADAPANALTYSLISAPSGMTIDANTGVISWTPTEVQGPGTYAVSVQVSDNSSPTLTATRSFNVSVREGNSAPVLSVLPPQSVQLNATLTITNGATDADVPVQNLTYTLISGPAGLNLNMDSGVITWKPTVAQRPSTNTVTVRVTDTYLPAASDTKSFTVIVLDTADTTKPTLVVSTPANNGRYAGDIVTVSGTAADNREVARVLCSLNGGGFTEAVGTTSWSLDLLPPAGTNTLSVKSVDASGNESTTISRTFFHVVLAPITVNVVGGGRVTPEVSGTLLEIGRTYTLTAVPFTDNWFTNWSGDLSGRNLTVSFMMQSNRTVTANFVTNNFIPLAGTYSGLFIAPAGVEQVSSGLLTLKLDKKRKFTGKVIGGGDRHPFTGTFNMAGEAISNVRRKGKSELNVSLRLDLVSGSDQVTGTVACAEWSAELLGDRAVYGVTNLTTNHVGRYTLVLPGATNSILSPAGNGYGLVSVGPKGDIKLVGGVGDTAAIRQAVPISKYGYWPLYAPLYRAPITYTNGLIVTTTKQYYGSTIGWVHFSTNGGPELSGLVAHVKQPAPTLVYPQGFSHEAQLMGSPYQVPATGMPAVAITNGLLSLQQCTSSDPVLADAVITPANVVQVPQPNAYKVSMRITPKTGRIRGTFLSNGTNKTVVVGAVLQNCDKAAGSFTVGTTSGALELENK